METPHGLEATAYYGGLIYFLDPSLMSYLDHGKYSLITRIELWNIARVASRRPPLIKRLFAEVFPLFALPLENGTRYHALQALSARWFVYNQHEILRAFIRYYYGLLRRYRMEKRYGSGIDYDVFGHCHGDSRIEYHLARVLAAELAVTRSQVSRRYVRRYCWAYGLSTAQVWNEILQLPTKTA